MLSPDFYNSDHSSESDYESDTDTGSQEDSDWDMSSDPNNDDEDEYDNDDFISTASDISLDTGSSAEDSEWSEDFDDDESIGGSRHNRIGRILPPSPTSWKFFERKIHQPEKSLPESSGSDYISNLPLDVFNEILLALEPRDLVSLSLVNHAFHRTALSPENKWIWVASLARSNLMPCPAGLNIYFWIHLLAGSQSCQECGMEEVADWEINFWLLRRICPDCLAENLISTNEFRAKFKDHSASILHLVRYSRSSDGRYSPSLKKFWMADVKYVYHKRGEFLSTKLPIDEQIQAWLAFGEQRKQLFRLLDQIAKDGKKWGVRMRRSQKQDLWITRNTRVEEIKKRFLELGLQDNDINLFRKHPGIYVEEPLSDYDWERVKEFYYPRIIKAQADRFRREREALVDRRRRSLEAAYHEWIQDSIDHERMTVSQAVLLPRSWELLDVEPFVSQIEAPSEVSVDFESYGDKFQGFISTWTARMLLDMDKIVPE